MIVTHNMQQAQRVSDQLRLLPRRGERARARSSSRARPSRCSTHPADPRTLDYVAGALRMTRRSSARSRAGRPVARVVAVVGHRWLAVPAPAAGVPGGDQRLGLVLRRAGHAAVGRRRADGGPQVNYLPTGSPAGPHRPTASRLIDFAGTEAEFSALQASGGETAAGLPVRARRRRRDGGACTTSQDAAGQQGRLPPPVAGARSPASSPATSAAGPTRPSARTTGASRCPTSPSTSSTARGQSGTTALFYDFVAHVAPDVFGPWAASNQLPDGNVRIIQLDSVARLRAARPRPSTARTRSPSTSPATPAPGASATTSSATPRPTAPRGVDPERSRATRCSPTPQNISAALESRHPATRPQPGAVRRLRQPQPDRLSDLGHVYFWLTEHARLQRYVLAFVPTPPPGERPRRLEPGRDAAGRGSGPS